MKKIISSVLMLLSMELYSQNVIKIRKPNPNQLFIYGLCNDTQPTVKLILNKDETFQFIDNSNPNKEINTTGKWTKEHDIIILSNYTSQFPIHKKWKVGENNILAKSRKGLTFYSLINLSECKNCESY